MAISRGLNLQSSGLTGRPRMLPPSLPPKYNLSMRRPPVETQEPVITAGLTPAMSPTKKPDFGIDSNNDVSSGNRFSGITPEDIDRLEPITMADVRANAGRGLMYGVPLALSGGNPLSLSAPLAVDLAATGVRKGAKYLYGKAKNALGLGGLYKGPFSGDEPNRGIVDAPSASADMEAELATGPGAWQAAGLPMAELAGEDAINAGIRSAPGSGDIDDPNPFGIDDGWFGGSDSDDDKDGGYSGPSDEGTSGFW